MIRLREVLFMNKLHPGACVAALLTLSMHSGHCADYPTRPVRLIVPFAPGGPTDIIARLVAPRLAESFQHQVVVDNRAGAGGNIGMGLAANATADGHTLVLVSSSFVVNPGLYKQLPYDPHKSFAPVSNWAAMPNVFVAHPGVAAKSMTELVKLIQASPRKFSFATPGIGTTPDLSAVLLRLTLKLDAASVPYNGAGPAVGAVVANQVQLGSIALPPTVPHIQAGRLRPLAVTSPKRSQVLPEVPTMAEAGYAGQEADTIQALLAPAATAPAIVQRIYEESAKVLARADVRERIGGMGFEILASTPTQLSAQIQIEVSKWSKVVREAGIKVE